MIFLIVFSIDCDDEISSLESGFLCRRGGEDFSDYGEIFRAKLEYCSNSTDAIIEEIKQTLGLRRGKIRSIGIIKLCKIS